MTLRKRILCTLTCLVCLSPSWIIAAEPSSTPSPSPSPVESASPPATIAQSVSELSAQRALAERSKIYRAGADYSRWLRSEEHTSELQSHLNLVCRLLLEKKKI